MNLRIVLCQAMARASLRQVGVLDRARVLRLLRNWDTICATGNTCGEEFSDQLMLLAVGAQALPESALGNTAGIDWQKLIEFIVTYLPVILEIVVAILALLTDRRDV